MGRRRCPLVRLSTYIRQWARAITLEEPPLGDNTTRRADAPSPRGRRAGNQSRRGRCVIGSVSPKPLPIPVSGSLIALNTCMRYSELRLLTWGQVDLNSCALTVGHSKTESGTGRLLPLNDRAVAVLGFWASLFSLREPNHFVFPAERYGASGNGATVVYESDPTRPIGRWKEAWESGKIRARVSCRFRDLRHTGCTRMLEAGVPFSVVATIMGWSPSTTVRMARRYGHIGQTAQRQAVNALKGVNFEGDGAQKWAHSQKAQMRQIAN